MRSGPKNMRGIGGSTTVPVGICAQAYCVANGLAVQSAFCDWVGAAARAGVDYYADADASPGPFFEGPAWVGDLAGARREEQVSLALVELRPAA